MTRAETARKCVRSCQATAFPSTSRTYASLMRAVAWRLWPARSPAMQRCAIRCNSACTSGISRSRASASPWPHFSNRPVISVAGSVMSSFYASLQPVPVFAAVSRFLSRRQTAMFKTISKGMRRPSSATDRQAGDRRTWKAAQKRPGLSIAVVTLAAMVPFSPRLAGADVVLDWNVTMMATLTGQSPFASARFAAITQLAVFEAVNAITGEYRPYLGTISAPAGASAEAAAAAAAHGVLKAYFPGQGGGARHCPCRLVDADSGWTCEDQWDCNRRSGRCGDGGAARGRRVGRRAVLPADFLGPRAVAADAVVSCTRWNLVSLAERHAVRRPERPSIPAGCSAATHKRGLSEGL